MSRKNSKRKSSKKLKNKTKNRRKNSKRFRMKQGNKKSITMKRTRRPQGSSSLLNENNRRIRQQYSNLRSGRGRGRRNITLGRYDHRSALRTGAAEDDMNENNNEDNNQSRGIRASEFNTSATNHRPVMVSSEERRRRYDARIEEEREALLREETFPEDSPEEFLATRQSDMATRATMDTNMRNPTYRANHIFQQIRNGNHRAIRVMMNSDSFIVKQMHLIEQTQNMGEFRGFSFLTYAIHSGRAVIVQMFLDALLRSRPRPDKRPDVIVTPDMINMTDNTRIMRMIQLCLRTDLSRPQIIDMLPRINAPIVEGGISSSRELGDIRRRHMRQGIDMNDIAEGLNNMNIQQDDPLSEIDNMTTIKQLKEFCKANKIKGCHSKRSDGTARWKKDNINEFRAWIREQYRKK